LNRYRGRLQIIRDVLLVLVSEDGSKKTHIMYGANLSYRLVTQYLDDALKAGLLKFDGKSIYTITSRGEDFLKFYETYENNRKELESYLEDLENGRETLAKMLSS